MFSSFSLEVCMDGYEEDASSTAASPSTLVATATSIKILREQHSDPRSQQFIAAMVPHALVDSSLRRTVYDRKASNNSKRNTNKKTQSRCLWLEQADRVRLSRDLLPRIHPIFKSNNPQQQQQQQQQNNNHPSIMIRAIFSTTGMAQHSPADVVLLDVPSSRRGDNSVNPSELLQDTTGEGILEEPDFILKLLIVSQVHIASTPMNLLASELEIPLCPVCFHRIDPARLGLPKPLNHQLCSKFCLVNKAAAEGCPKQRFLTAWPEPSHCVACRVIHDYQTVGAATHNIMSSANCKQCALQKTLWVCLTCGFCGCGRYSNKHAEAHFLESGHSYSLELATLRVWDYANGGEFAHRGDLLECPAGRQQRAKALQIQQEMADAMMSMGGAAVASAAPTPAACATTTETWHQQQPYYWNDHGDEKSPKKAILIGEEYEALLQSALEDQTLHYQGEISRLRAALTQEQVDMDSLTREEAEAVEKLKSEISRLRTQADRVGRDLLDAQAQEAGHRADSQRLLREQQVAQDLLKTIQEDTKREQDQGKRQVEELEQQIADLTANLRIRHQFSQDQELNNAQIFGTMTSPNQAKGPSNKKGKLRKFWRK